MQTIIANIKHAIRNKQNTVIGGGDFSPSDLLKILELYEAAKLAKEALIWNYGGEPLPTLEIEAINKLKNILGE